MPSTVEYLLHPVWDFLLVVESTGGDSLAEWIDVNCDSIESRLIDHGAVLLRGFASEPEQLGQLAERLWSSDQLLDSYGGGAAPRVRLDKYVFLASTLPPAIVLLQHHEMSYLPVFPHRLLFYCVRPAEFGGSTPLCCANHVWSRLPDDVRTTFQKRGIKYIRNYHAPHGNSRIFLSWQKALEANNRAEAEATLKAKKLDFEWVSDDHLHTECKLDAVRYHPVTGNPVFFNHSILLTTYSGGAERGNPFLRSMRGGLTAEDLQSIHEHSFEHQPFATAFGDGTPIDLATQEAIAQVYRECQVEFSWKPGDMLILDNMRTSHGRNTYIGDREVRVAIARPSQPS